MDKKDFSFAMAARLKQLRNEHGLSHQKLSDTLDEMLGIGISPDSLKKYEVATEHHSTPFKNLGMRVEYLTALATLYNVSTDYILGLTDIRSPSADTQAIIAQTGLTEDNVSLLEGFQSQKLTEHLGFLNDLISVIMESDMIVHYFMMKTTLTIPTFAPSGDIDDVIDSWMDADRMRKRGLVQLSGEEAFHYYCSRIAKALEDALLQKYSSVAEWRERDGID